MNSKKCIKIGFRLSKILKLNKFFFNTNLLLDLGSQPQYTIFDMKFIQATIILAIFTAYSVAYPAASKSYP
jgi:hypothetical membrane protein